MLCQFELGVIVATHLIEQTPEYFQEGMLLSFIIVIFICQKIDIAGFYNGS